MFKSAIKIYNNLPPSLQNTAISAYGMLWKNRRFGGIFEQEYTGFKEREHYTSNQWHEYQTIKLREILKHAYLNVPYYKQVFEKNGWNIDSLKRFELHQLATLPFLDKSTLRAEGTTSLISVNLEKGGTFLSSSGTTGTPTKILYSHAMHQRVFAAYESRVRNWAGINRLMKRASIGGRRILPDADAKPPYYRINYAEKQIYLSAYHISAQTAHNYVDGIRDFGAEYMTGYTMSNYILARFLENGNIEAPEMKALVLSSEKLTPEMRATFTKVYGCKAFDGWSGVENCALISENEFGQLLVSPDMGIIEILNDQNEPVKPGETGHVVCTGFLNYDQPLIRYRIGDRVTLAKEQHTLCGRHMMVISDIEGRIEDIISGPDGRQMVRFHGIFVDLHSVIEAQLIQHTLHDYEIKVATSGAFDENDKLIMIKRMQTQLGTVNVYFTEVSHIPKGANGKFKAVVSRVTGGG
jgi:phenylacetate-CoA ligase